MEIDPADLDRAVADGTVSRAQADALLAQLAPGAGRTGPSPDGATSPTVKAYGRFRALLLGASAVAIWGGAMWSASAAFAWASTHPGRGLVSGLVGVLLLVTGFVMDARALEPRAGVLRVLGLLSVVGGVATSGGEKPVSMPLALAVGAVLVLLGFLLRRRSFAIAGALALAGVAGQLADEMLVPAAFPLVLAGIGLAFTAAGLAWRRFAPPVGDRMFERLPAALRNALAPARR